MTKLTKEYLYNAFWVECLTLSKVAKINNCSTTKIHNACKKYNIQTPSLSESRLRVGLQIRQQKGKQHIEFCKKYNIELIGEYTHSKAHTKYKCKCGNTFISTPNSIGRNTTSCGQCNAPKIGDIFWDNIEIIEVRHVPASSGCSLKVKCLNCGNVFGYIKSYRIISGHQKSCGNCNLSRNGVAISFMQQQIQQWCDIILNENGILEYKIPYAGSVDIVYYKNKIAIECDCYYYHRIRYNSQKREERKRKACIDAGYKFLRIRYDNDNFNDPTLQKEVIQQLQKILLNDFQHNEKEAIIILEGWKTAPKRRKELEYKRKINTLEWTHWTKEEIEILKKNMNVPNKLLHQKYLPNRTIGAIGSRKTIIKKQDKIK